MDINSKRGTFPHIHKTIDCWQLIQFLLKCKTCCWRTIKRLKQCFYLSTHFKCKSKSEVSSSQLPQTLLFFSWRVWGGKAGGDRWKRAGNTNMITTVAQTQVITGVKRSPASPEANEPLSPFHLCRGELCHLQIAGETWFTSLQPPTSHCTK